MTSSPQMSSQASWFNVQSALQARAPVAKPRSVQSVRPPKSVPSHSSAPVAVPSPQSFTVTVALSAYAKVAFGSNCWDAAAHTKYVPSTVTVADVAEQKPGTTSPNESSLNASDVRPSTSKISTWLSSAWSSQALLPR